MAARINELWQLYDERGCAIKGLGASKAEVFKKGLLHGASHIWIWRQTKNGPEVLIQKRAANKRVGPNLYDISAAGHIDLGEEPLTTALREAKEEVALSINPPNLKFIGVRHAYLIAPSGDIENEFQWLYLFRMDNDEDFIINKSEVSAVEWKKISTFKKELKSNSKKYVPHGKIYYDIITSAIEQETARS